MKAVVIKTDLTIQEIELKKPLHQSLNAAIDGSFEVVRPRRLQPPYVMIVNEDYINLGLPRNEIGCYLYETLIHGHPIQGNIIIMQERIVNKAGEYDLVGLDPLDVPLVIKAMEQIKKLVCTDVYRRAQ